MPESTVGRSGDSARRASYGRVKQGKKRGVGASASRREWSGGKGTTDSGRARGFSQQSKTSRNSGQDRKNTRRAEDSRSRERNTGRSTRPNQLPIPDEVTGDELDSPVRQELRTLPKGLADQVGKHLVMAGRLVDTEPELAYRHAKVAQRMASRLPVTRQTAGLAAYRTGRYAEALSELRAARRMSGSPAYWAVMADCERGLGRPERAIAMAGAPEVRALDEATQAEMRIVASGARRDLGQADAAVVTLQGPELAAAADKPWTARLRYAYADALLAIGRRDEARKWFTRAVEADFQEETDAAERLAELDDVSSAPPELPADPATG